ncbi:MAG: acyl-CoA dehydrogenase family protein [Pseudomonadales bacterium]
MHTHLTADLERFRDDVREFFSSHLNDELRAARRYMTSVYCDYESAMTWQRILLEKGWLVPSWPREYGGTGWSLTERFIFDCESARAGPPPISPMGLGMLGPALLGHGTKEQKNYYLPRMQRGDDFWCQGYSEPQAGSDLAALQCRAERSSAGDDYVVNGTKIWTTHAHYANRMFCLVRTGRFERPQQGVTFLLIDLDSPGVSRHPIHFYSGDTEQCQVVFDDVRVPQSNVVGKENEGWSVTKYLLEFERGSKPAAPGLLEGIRRLRDLAAITGAADPELDRRSSLLETRALALEATELRCLADAERTGSPGPSASMLKVQATELSQAISALTVEAAGAWALAYQPEVIEARGALPAIGPDAALTAMPFYFNNRAATIYGGSNEIQRNIMAKRVLGL